jgi:hypothetical protein
MGNQNYLLTWNLQICFYYMYCSTKLCLHVLQWGHDIGQWEKIMYHSYKKQTIWFYWLWLILTTVMSRDLQFDCVHCCNVQLDSYYGYDYPFKVILTMITNDDTSSWHGFLLRYHQNSNLILTVRLRLCMCITWSWLFSLFVSDYCIIWNQIWFWL